MASAVAPDLSVVAVHDAQNLSETGIRGDIEIAVALDTQGAEYDVAVADSSTAGKVLRKRALAAKLMERSTEVSRLTIRLEKAIATGDVEGHPVTITRHLEGTPLPFDQLSLAQCTSLGTAIASVHLVDTTFLLDAGYPRFTAEGIRADLTAWVARLKQSPEVPQAIVERWEQLAGIDALWQFTPRTLHGDFSPNDILFRDDSVRAMRNWENIQVSDPARDFAWAYEDWMTDQQRDALLSAYGRMMGSHMDARIVPRARLWRQMDIVRDLLRALDAADRTWIRAARARVEKLATLLNPVIPVTPKAPSEESPHDEASSTITVGTLLSESSDSPVASEQNSAEHTPMPAPHHDPIPVPSARNSAENGTDGSVVDPELEELRAAKTEAFDRHHTHDAEETRETETQGHAEGLQGLRGLSDKPGYVSLDEDKDEDKDNSSESPNADD
jgi:aminoglycoside phosphotransferase (APT) family kinase protein